MKSWTVHRFPIIRCGASHLVVSLALLSNAVLPPPASAESQRLSNRVLVFVADGMRHDLMKRFVDEGKMPTYEMLLANGIEGQNGMIPIGPPNTGVVWTSLATGASPSANGVTNNTFHDNTQPITPFGKSGFDPSTNLAETIAERADDEGLTVAALGWQAFDLSSVPNGVTVAAFLTWLTGRGIVANFPVPLQFTEILPPGTFLSNTMVTLMDASGWTNVPASFSPARETTFTQVSFLAFPFPTLNFQVYVYDSTDDGVANYDTALVSRTKNGVDEVASLRDGEWSGNIRASVLGIEGGFYVKMIDLEPDLSRFRLFFTQITRVEATPQSLEDFLVANFDAVMPNDFSPFILGLVDGDTFVEQHLMGSDVLGLEIFPYIIKTFEPDLVLAGIQQTDSIQHRFLAKAMPGNPLFDPDQAPIFQGYLEQSYQQADRMLQALWGEMPDANVFATADHGFSNSGFVINANLLLATLGLFDPASPSSSRAVAYAAGGTAQIYVNLKGRNPGGVVEEGEFDAIRRDIIGAFESLGPDLTERVLLKEETSSIPTTEGVEMNMLHPDRTGDVVVFTAPPYQFDAPLPGEPVAPISFMAGQHGYVPQGDLDRFAVFVAAGPGIIDGKFGKAGAGRGRRDFGPVTSLDVAPTVACILGIDPPAQSEGKVLRILESSLDKKCAEKGKSR